MGWIVRAAVRAASLGCGLPAALAGGARRVPCLGVAALLLTLATSAASADPDDTASRAEEIVPIEAHNGAFVVPVLVNNVMTLKFIVDSGAADVSIPADIAAALKSMGTISSDDFLGNKTYLLADGSKVPSEIYRISSLKIGDLVMQNVTVRIAAENSSLLLGQSFLSRLKSWAMDNSRKVLVIH